MKLRHITLTGADDTINPMDLVRLTKKYPRVEWGILIGSADRLGTPRYPSTDWMEEAAMLRLPYSIHACGKHARNMLKGIAPNAILQLKARRVQLNVSYGNRSVTKNEIHNSVRAAYPAQLVLQIGDAVKADWSIVPQGVDVLFDASGGKGKEIKYFPISPYCDCNGYAGGIGPDNFEAVLNELSLFLGEYAPTWIDMETKLRDENDKFDLLKCAVILDHCHRLY